MRTLRTSLVIVTVCAVVSCAPPAPYEQMKPGKESSYLLVSAGDADEADSDFLAVIDLRSDSAQLGEVIQTMPTGMKSSMPHHMEYAMPPAGVLLHECPSSRDEHAPGCIQPPCDPRGEDIRTSAAAAVSPRLFADTRWHTPRRVSAQRGQEHRSRGDVTPGNHGGIAEYSADGILLRQAIAGNAGGKPVRPYAFALLPELDRLVVTSAPMMEIVSADVLQIYRYSDFTLLQTIALPPGKLADGREVEGSQRAGFGPRVLSDGSVFLNSYGCTFYRLSEIGTNHPRLDTFFALDTPPPSSEPGAIRGSCGIPVVFGNYWINPVGQLHAVVVLDIGNPARPREVFRLRTPPAFSPHWLARDPQFNRLVLGAELGGEEGVYILRFDEQTGRLSFDPALEGEGQSGYVSLKNQSWPHGPSGPAWAHAALFLP